MKIKKTPQDRYEVYLWDIGRFEPRGIETSAVVLSKLQFLELHSMLNQIVSSGVLK